MVLMPPYIQTGFVVQRAAVDLNLMHCLIEFQKFKMVLHCCALCSNTLDGSFCSFPGFLLILANQDFHIFVLESKQISLCCNKPLGKCLIINSIVHFNAAKFLRLEINWI